jgi:hypothetical protein
MRFLLSLTRSSLGCPTRCSRKKKEGDDSSVKVAERLASYVEEKVLACRKYARLLPVA